MKDELYPLTEGQQVVTITSGAEVPKILNVIIRNGIPFDRDFIPYEETHGYNPEKSLVDCFGGSYGFIPRNKVYDEPQLSAQINILQRTIINLIEGDDLSREEYDETYFGVSNKYIERPVYKEEDIARVIQQEELIQIASHYFRMHLSIALLIDSQMLSEEKYNEVYDKTREDYIKEFSGIDK